MTQTVLPLWINGQARPAASTRLADITNPASGEIVRQAPLANSEDVNAAVAAAKAAFPAWRATTPLRRARILTRFRELMEKNRDELAQLASEEHG